MATIVRAGRLRVKLYGPPREHPPPHVHVEVGRVGVVVIRLALGNNPLQVWRVHGEVDDSVVLETVRLVERHEGAIRLAWERMHG